MAGAARLVVAVGIGVGLVALANADPRRVNVGEAAPAQAAVASGAATVPLSTRLLSCPGQELSGIVGVPDEAISGTVTAASLPESLRPAGVSGEGTLMLTAPAAPAAPATPAAPAAPALVSGPAQVTALPLPTGTDPVGLRSDGAAAPGSTASQEWSSDTATLRGLAGTACPTAASDVWLIAGGGAPGRQERLVLANPGANEVSASIEVLGAKGPVTAAGNRGVVVPAGGRTVVLVDALAPSEPTPVIHVVVDGGLVAATVTDTWLDGSVAAGAETTGPTAPPALTQVMPVLRREQGGALRIAVPGSAQAVVSTRLLTASGPVPLAADGGGVQRIQSGAVLELPLPAIGEEVVGVEVSSDVPVLAAAVSVARAEGAVGDFAWSAAGEAISQLAGIALDSAGPQRRLNLVATGGAVSAQIVRLAGGSVTTTDVSIAADRVVTQDLGTPDAVWVVRTGGSGELRAGVLSQGGQGVTAFISSVTLAELPMTTAATTAVPLP